jgi:aspartate aminotransferase
MEIWEKYEQMLADDHPDKCDLLMGAYHDANGKPWVFPSVRVVEKLMADDSNLDHVYLNLDGLTDFN